MKPTRENLITALRSGIATRDELQAHFNCDSAELTKPLANLTQHKLADRYLEEGKAAYRLTAKGKKWKPGVVAHGAEEDLADSVGEANPYVARDPALLTTTQADDELPPSDPALLASANRTLHEQLAAKDTELIAQAALVVDLREQVATQANTVAAKVTAIDGLRAELTNATALADKLQHLLDSSRHECVALRAQLEAQRHTAEVVPITAAQTCCGKCGDPEPDMETVPLRALLEAVSPFLDEGQTITIHPDHVVTINAFGKTFAGRPGEAAHLLDASATLIRAEAA